MIVFHPGEDPKALRVLVDPTQLSYESLYTYTQTRETHKQTFELDSHGRMNLSDECSTQVLVHKMHKIGSEHPSDLGSMLASVEK